MKKLIVLLMSVAMLGLSGVAQAVDLEAGKLKATTICAACHGPTGVSVNPLWPNLAGQQKEYMMKQLKAFKDGTRKDPAMSPMALILTDADVESVSAYFSSLKCSE